MYFEFAKPKTKVILQIRPQGPFPDSVEVKFDTLEELLVSLKMKNMITNCAVELLETLGSFPQDLTKTGDKEKKSISGKFTKVVEKFATTLYLYSPEAYNIINSVFMLPSEGVLQKRLRSEDYFPGFTQEAIDLLTSTATAYPSDLCSLMFDFVPLKKQKDFVTSSKRWIGHVDFGGGLDPEDSDGIPLASEILTFTAVGLTREWKIPFGYFLVGEMCAVTLQNVIKEAIVVLEECGLRVKVLVCDGSPRTIRMAANFGCQIHVKSFKELVTGFPHPLDGQRKIQLIFGLHHSLDLLRNVIMSKSILRSHTYGVSSPRFLFIRCKWCLHLFLYF